ncbi:hypothetical protein HNR39_000764 [Glaciimonas immobilis]|uniref:Uncharacterized protein n=1 Tax=Glaciimonas immobilis TaxID=728004 RepID=A0A840RQF6_9BURK|nr:hypothetical protein [Glaciimonas immobilis]
MSSVDISALDGALITVLIVGAAGVALYILRFTFAIIRNAIV